jgi:hypothetical protein
MNALNTKFSSGDTVPQMTPNQYRTDIGMGSDKPWQDYLKKARKVQKERARIFHERERAKAAEYRAKRKARLAAAAAIEGGEVVQCGSVYSVKGDA